jgi:hypothetical protein
VQSAKPAKKYSADGLCSRADIQSHQGLDLCGFDHGVGPDTGAAGASGLGPFSAVQNVGFHFFTDQDGSMLIELAREYIKLKYISPSCSAF